MNNKENQMKELNSLEDVVVTISKKKDHMFKVLGYITSIIPPFVSFIFFYQQFFFRAEYLTRKNLLKYLQSNKPPKKEANNPYITNKFGHYWEEGKMTLHLWKDGAVSLHNNRECVISSFCSGIADKRNYKKY